MATKYTKPGEVLSPKRRWQLFSVLFDGGPGGVEDSNYSSVSLAIGRWDDRSVLAMRWNGNEANRNGNPQSRGLPTWFIVPDQYAQAILEVSFSHPKLKFARDFLELKRVYFLSRCQTTTCSNFGELTLANYRSEELQTHLAALDQDDLQFYCIFCDEEWHPTPDEKKRLRADMEKGWELFCEKARDRR